MIDTSRVTRWNGEHLPEGSKQLETRNCEISALVLRFHKKELCTYTLSTWSAESSQRDNHTNISLT